jgi:hypothetical protein
VAVRDGPVVAATVKPTVPLPVPEVVASEIQLTSLDAVHGQPAAAVTVTAFDPPAAPAAYADGAIAYVQPSDCVTLKCSPAIVSVPVRGRPVVGATLNATGAEPFPLAPDVIAIQSASDAAVHVQSALDARTSTLPDPPACENDAELFASVSRHWAAACVTCARNPFSMMPPLRATGSPLAAAANSTVPLPCPERPAVMLSHGTSGSAVHSHSRSVLTGIAPLPPSAGRVAVGASNATAHLDNADGDV